MGAEVRHPPPQHSKTGSLRRNCSVRWQLWVAQWLALIQPVPLLRGEGEARHASRTLQARGCSRTMARASPETWIREEPGRASGATRRLLGRDAALDLLGRRRDHARMNKKNGFAFSVAALVSVLAHGQAPAPVPVFSPERFRAHVEFLADDLLEGRKTGTRGHEIAARYTASQFEASGLRPGGENGSWYQPITFQLTTRATEPAWLAINGPAGEQRFSHADNVLV